MYLNSICIHSLNFTINLIISWKKKFYLYLLKKYRFDI